MARPFSVPETPLCPTCEYYHLRLNCIMGYWECMIGFADEPFRYWLIGEGGTLEEVTGDTCVEDDGTVIRVEG